MLKILCWLNLHKYNILKTNVASDDTLRALVKCKRCEKHFHFIAVPTGTGKYTSGFLPLCKCYEEMWDNIQ